MSMEVLKDFGQIREARSELLSRGVSAIDSPMKSFLRRLRLNRGINIGDDLKSWDVRETLKFIEQRLKRDEPILDIGCYASEIVVALHKAGYTKLTGVDLNPDLNRMPYRDSIRYEVGNFLKSPFPDASFKAITSISVIEHGFDGPALCREMSRLLMPGGFLVVSFDYWPEKIDTSGIRLFDMSWTLFSRQDVAGLIEEAARHRLLPVGNLNYDAREAPIKFGGKNYTFAWIALQKSGGS